MYDHDSPAGCEFTPNLAQDVAAQRVVLTHVLALHPTHLSIHVLVRELTAGSEEFAQDDVFERAIRDLTGVGLLDCSGGVVATSRAALHCDRLGLL